MNIYLNFGGNCRDAFQFYRSVFGGEFARFGINWMLLNHELTGA